MAFSMWRKLGHLNYARLVADAFMIPEIDEDSNEPLPLGYYFMDGISMRHLNCPKEFPCATQAVVRIEFPCATQTILWTKLPCAT